MNKNILPVAAIAIGMTLSVSITSCSEKEQSQKGGVLDIEDQIENAYKPVTTDTVQAIEYNLNGKKTPATLIQKYFRGDSAEIYLSVTVGTLDNYPATNSYVAGKLRDLYGYVTDTTPVSGKVSSAAQLDDAIMALGAQFVQDVAPVYETSMMPVFNITANLQPVWASDAVVTYNVFDYYYTGGAHGMCDFYYETIDPATGSPLGLERLVKPDKVTEFREHLVSVIAESKKMSVPEYLHSVNEYVMPEEGKEITAENFPIYHIGLTADGLAVIYPPYSIAPYAEGQPAFIIPSEGYLAL